MTAKSEDAAVTLQYEITSTICEEMGLAEHLASNLADAITRRLRARFGGEDIYIPATDKRVRDEEIRREFNGRNRREVCRKYDISKSRFYEIIGKR